MSSEEGDNTPIPLVDHTLRYHGQDFKQIFLEGSPFGQEPSEYHLLRELLGANLYHGNIILILDDNNVADLASEAKAHAIMSSIYKNAQTYSAQQTIDVMFNEIKELDTARGILRVIKNQALNEEYSPRAELELDLSNISLKQKLAVYHTMTGNYVLARQLIIEGIDLLTDKIYTEDGEIKRVIELKSLVFDYEDVNYDGWMDSLDEELTTIGVAKRLKPTLQFNGLTPLAYVIEHGTDSTPHPKSFQEELKLASSPEEERYEDADELKNDIDEVRNALQTETHNPILKYLGEKIALEKIPGEKLIIGVDAEFIEFSRDINGQEVSELFIISDGDETLIDIFNQEHMARVYHTVNCDEFVMRFGRFKTTIFPGFLGVNTEEQEEAQDKTKTGDESENSTN